MKVSVEYVINNDKKLRKVLMNANNLTEIKNNLKEHHNTNDIKIFMIIQKKGE